MNSVALKMLMGDRAKYVGILIGLTFASLLITQLSSTFVGLMTRTFGFITDASQADIWVMDQKVLFIDDVKPLQDTMLSRVRGIEGVQWAVPLYKGLVKARLENGSFQTCNVLGLDDATMIGGPPYVTTGKLEDLRRNEAVIVDELNAATKLAKPSATPGGMPTPLKVGDTLELNDHRAIVVGFCKATRTFQSQPVIYTTYTRAVTLAPRERKMLSFVLVKASLGQDVDALCKRIEKTTGLAARPRDGFKWLTVMYFMKYTGIPINIGIGVITSFIVGTVIAGQTFYNFTLENQKYFGAIKAMGASNGLLLRMILLQALLVGILGYGLGIGGAALIGYLCRNTELAFLLLWQVLAVTGAAILSICALSAAISIHRVMKLEPAVVFKG